MLSCFTTQKEQAIPIQFVTPIDYVHWLQEQNETTKQWLTNTKFSPESGSIRIIPDAKNQIAFILYCIIDRNNLWEAGLLPMMLPEGKYFFALDQANYATFALGWGLGAYQFTRYKKPLRNPATLFLEEELSAKINNIVESIYLVRDLINTPTDDMGPTQLAACAKALANEFQATFQEIIGEELLAANYASIYTVGRASDDPPRLLDLTWGDDKHPKVTLVGKGVCFDSGGLDLKPPSAMLLMKKDMAGGAHVLGLARMIMAAKLPLRLRVLIPAVENAISGSAYRPGDVVKSRKGITVEIGNTDAEGRVVLSDALTEAVSENPEILIDISTLTGAARVALGTDLAAVFSNNNELVDGVSKIGTKSFDPMWRLPLYKPYREFINSPIADLNNSSTEPYAGAITAALFLQEFVPDHIPWLHFDLMAWNTRLRPGRPIGGEAMTLRALFQYLCEKYQS